MSGQVPRGAKACQATKLCKPAEAGIRSDASPGSGRGGGNRGRKGLKWVTQGCCLIDGTSFGNSAGCESSNS